MITFNCSGCESQYQVPDEYVGKKVRCKKCDTVNKIIPTPVIIEDIEVSEDDSGSRISKAKKETPYRENTPKIFMIIKAVLYVTCFLVVTGIFIF